MPDFRNYNGENIELGLQATTTSDGLISKEDKVKLNEIALGANNYTHPATHPASIIVQDTSNRFVTDTEKSNWNAKASTAVVTTTTNGLMIASDKVKLDGIAAGANAYTHPTNHPASIITQDSSNRFVTDAEKATWNAKASTSVATTTANGLMSSTDKSKLDGIATGANAYTHPTTSGNKHIPSGGSSGQILRWSADGTAVWGTDNNTTYTNATTSAAGLMSAADKVKLDGIATNANNFTYTHPTTHPASIITQDSSNRFVTDAEKATWNAKASTAVVTTTTNGLMAYADKVKLNGIATGANAYTHPAYTARTGVPTANAAPGFGGTFTVSQPVSDATGHITAVNSRTITIPNAVATTSAAGLMSAADKVKLNNMSYEYGFDTNTMAYYRKYGDGTVDMYGMFSDPLMAPINSYGNMYVSSIYAIKYPVTLLNGMEAYYSFTPQGTYPFIVYALTGLNNNIATGVNIQIAYPTYPPKDFYGIVHWRVIGRWK